MRPYKSQKIDLNSEYPCPCRRKGRLLAITLTEAFGCDRCQQIFVVEDNSQTIEQLSSTYPYKRAWRWSGNRWVLANSGWSENYLPVAMGIILLLLIVWLPIALRVSSGLGIIVWTLIAVMVAILPALIHWLANRR